MRICCGHFYLHCYSMADDLDDEWWKENDGKDESPADEGRDHQRGVKRLAPSDDSEDDESEDEADKDKTVSVKSAPAKVKPQQQKQKGKKQKKKKGRGKFVRKKITGEDEENLKKAGTPEDVRELLKPLVAVATHSDAESDSDNDSDENDLSLESDFFPANQSLPGEEYLEEILPGWQVVLSKAKLSPGSPLILILCSSALRAVQLNRDIKSFLGKECKTAKLFAKHMKLKTLEAHPVKASSKADTLKNKFYAFLRLEEQKQFLQKKVCHAAIGTPNRVQSLLEAGTLTLGSLHAIVLDWNWRDVKLKRMVDIPDVRQDLTLLLKEHAVEKIKHTPCRIAIL